MKNRKCHPPLWSCKHGGRGISMVLGVCLHMRMLQLHHSSISAVPNQNADPDQGVAFILSPLFFSPFIHLSIGPIF